MPLPKFTKDDSTRLFKFVSRVFFSYNLFDGRKKTVMDMLLRLNAPRFIKSNPKLILDVEEHNKPNPPWMEFTFTDGSKHTVNPAVGMTAEDILLYVHAKAEIVDFEAEIALGADPPVDANEFLPKKKKAF